MCPMASQACRSWISRAGSALLVPANLCTASAVVHAWTASCSTVLRPSRLATASVPPCRGAEPAASERGGHVHAAAVIGRNVAALIMTRRAFAPNDPQAGGHASGVCGVCVGFVIFLGPASTRTQGARVAVNACGRIRAARRDGRLFHPPFLPPGFPVIVCALHRDSPGDCCHCSGIRWMSTGVQRFLLRHHLSRYSAWP